MVTVLLVLLLGQVAPAPATGPMDLSKATVSQPKLVAAIDTGKVQGEPIGISWDADGTIYMRVSQVDAWGNERAKHYLIPTTSLPATLKATDGVPPWAATYWTMKSAMFAPGDMSFKVETERRTERARSTNVANAGGLAGMSSQALPSGDGGQGQNAAETMDAANKAYTSTTVTMKVKGQVVGEWTNVPPQPGMRFGWAPAPFAALAYAANNKKLTLLDKQGNTLEVAGTSDVLLPAWSMDGKRIAFLQKTAKKKYTLMVVEVTGK